MAKQRAKRTSKSIWVELGRKGGLARASRLTAAERRRIAMLGVKARREKRRRVAKQMRREV